MSNSELIAPAVKALVDRGVVIPCPHAVEVGHEIVPDRIAAGVVLHTGSRLLGAATSVGPGCKVGTEGPAVVENCQLGRNVELGGGSFSGATFLDGSRMGSAAHVRSGTLLEEESSGAHAVGFKQTVLLPFVTAGSLINFCDCLMAGGTSRRHHSEIGSSYIHFNFTPHQDKATASLIGDVPKGVLLDQAPIFLGGQGGLVGPCRIAFGSVIPAGSVTRRDVLEEGLLVVGQPPRAASIRYAPGLYRSISRILTNSFLYIGNIRALLEWYRHVRRPAMTADAFSVACCEGAMNRLEEILSERIKRLGELAQKMAASLDIARSEGAGALKPCFEEQDRFMKKWPQLEARLEALRAEEQGARDRDEFLRYWEKTSRGGTFVEAIGRLEPDARRHGTAWLQSIVSAVEAVRAGI